MGIVSPPPLLPPLPPQLRLLLWEAEEPKMAVAMLSSAEVQALSNSLVTELGRTGRKAGKGRQRCGDAGPPLPPETAPGIAASSATATARHGPGLDRLPEHRKQGMQRWLYPSSASCPTTAAPYLWPATRRAPGCPR